ncbi:hypothetical protein RB595_008316 [Gaeumannomyces hyphopodioides]
MACIAISFCALGTSASRKPGSRSSKNSSSEPAKREARHIWHRSVCGDGLDEPQKPPRPAPSRRYLLSALPRPSPAPAGPGRNAVVAAATRFSVVDAATHELAYTLLTEFGRGRARRRSVAVGSVRRSVRVYDFDEVAQLFTAGRHAGGTGRFAQGGEPPPAAVLSASDTAWRVWLCEPMGTATAYFPPHTVSRIGTIDLPQSKRRLRWRATSPLGMVDDDLCPSPGGDVVPAADEAEDAGAVAAPAATTTSTPRPISNHSAFKLVSVDERAASASGPAPPVVARFDRVGDVGCARMEGQLRVYNVEDYEREVGGREVLDVLMLLSLSSVVRPLSLRQAKAVAGKDGEEVSPA